MKGKILTIVKNMFVQNGLSDKVIEELAKIIESQVTDESTDEDITAKAELLTPLLTVFQANIDKRVTDAIAKAKEPKKEPKNEPKQQQKNELVIEELINKALAPIVEKIALFEAGQTATTREKKANEKFANLNEQLRTKALKDLSRMTFKDELDFDSYLDETAKELEEIQIPVQVGVRPQASTGKPNTAGDEEINALVDSIM